MVVNLNLGLRPFGNKCIPYHIFRYKYIVVMYNTAYLLRMKVTPNKYSETDIIRMVAFFIDNIYVKFGGHVYQQTVGIRMCTIGSRFVLIFIRY